jgi:hypothetical protein
MKVKARLAGHEFDLVTLGELFREGDPTVAADSEGYYLAFAASDDLIHDGSVLYKVASSLLHRVNGTGRVCGSEFRPARLTGRFSDDAGRQHAVVLADTAEVRAAAFPVRALVDGRQAEVPPPPGPGHVQLAAADPDVAEVLEILGTAEPAPDWVELYKVFEIVRSKVSRLDKKGWVTSAEISAFTASANRPDVSGAQARHARMPGGRPKGTMTLVEARQMIGVLVTAWLDSLRPRFAPFR